VIASHREQTAAQWTHGHHSSFIIIHHPSAAPAQQAREKEENMQPLTAVWVHILAELMRALQKVIC
jgi:hypothetical protein